MARRVIHELIDDLDGRLADESVTFSIDGAQYRIDLSHANAGRLRDALAPFVAAGTVVGRGGVVPKQHPSPTTRAAAAPRRDRARSRAIRRWAEARGYELPERGRIKQEIVERYEAEGGD